MKRTVWTFGLISGAIISVMMMATIPFMDRIGFDRGMVIGYASMVLSFLLVFYGIRSYRDNVSGGTISFGRAFTVGILITLVSSTCYVLTWQVVYYNFVPDFGEKYASYMEEKARASGQSEQAIETQIAEVRSNMAMYKNPIWNVLLPFIEPLPVGLVITLISAWVLRRRPDRAMVAALA